MSVIANGGTWFATGPAVKRHLPDQVNIRLISQLIIDFKGSPKTA